MTGEISGQGVRGREVLHRHPLSLPQHREHPRHAQLTRQALRRFPLPPIVAEPIQNEVPRFWTLPLPSQKELSFGVYLGVENAKVLKKLEYFNSFST